MFLNVKCIDLSEVFKVKIHFLKQSFFRFFIQFQLSVVLSSFWKSVHSWPIDSPVSQSVALWSESVGASIYNLYLQECVQIYFLFTHVFIQVFSFFFLKQENFFICLFIAGKNGFRWFSSKRSTKIVAKIDFKLLCNWFANTK